MNKLKLIFVLLFTLPVTSCLASKKMTLTVKGKSIDYIEEINRSTLRQGAFISSFESDGGKKLELDFKLKKLSGSRSFPKNVDITIKQSAKKVGYLFFALNDILFLEKLGEFGLKIKLDSQLVDFNFSFGKLEGGDLDFNDLDTERFFQDTLIPSKGFQMIRPVVVPLISKDIREKEFLLDNHLYSVSYRIINIGNGVIRFEHSLYGIEKKKKELISQFYFSVNTLKDLRRVMYAYKSFNLAKDYGTAKLVFYPALGQLEPISKQ